MGIDFQNAWKVICISFFNSTDILVIIAWDEQWQFFKMGLLYKFHSFTNHLSQNTCKHTTDTLHNMHGWVLLIPLAHFNLDYKEDKKTTFLQL